MTKVKICGITRDQDAQDAVAAGADALGFVFYPKSPRYVRPEIARDIIQNLPPFVTCIGLFVDAPREEVAQVAERSCINMIQFHGNESSDYCESFSLPYIKAVRFESNEQVQEVVDQHPQARAVLVDAFVPGIPGGTGQTFDWDELGTFSMPLILAGGLRPENVRSAIHKLRPYAVDVSGGVELEKGIKDSQKIQNFIKEVSCAG